MKPHKVKGSNKEERQSATHLVITMEQGGRELGKILKDQPIALSDCNMKKANAGDLEQQICIAQAYLSNKDCAKAKLWAEKALYQNSKNEYSMAALELVSMLDRSGKCIDGYNASKENEEFWKEARKVLGDIIPEGFGDAKANDEEF